MNDADETTAFRRNMPSDYVQLFAQQAIAEHFEIVERRGEKSVHAELWRTFPGGIAVVCVAALDYPGLLSAVTTAFLLHRLTISTAQIYSRHNPDGSVEAVDFFWLRRRDAGPKRNSPPSAQQIEQSIATLLGFVRAKAVPWSVGTQLPPSLATPAQAFFRPTNNGQHELVIEAMDGPGLMSQIARTLYELDLTIVSSDIRTQHGMALDRFVLAPAVSGELGELERERIRARVVESIDNWRRLYTLRMGA